MVSTSERRSALIVDPHPLWLDAVTEVLGRADVEVIGSTTSSRIALELLRERAPDLLVTGIAMPEGEPDGLALVRQAREEVPGLKAIVLSRYDDPQRIEAAMAAGATAYVLKTAHPDDLTSAVRQAFNHSVYLASGPRGEAPRAALTETPGLTRREHEILQLVAEGHSNAELARMLWVTEQTVKFHLSNIYRKLKVSNRTEASRWAQLHGLLTDSSAAAAAQVSVG